MTREWQEASNEKALEQKENPFTGTLTPLFHDVSSHPSPLVVSIVPADRWFMCCSLLDTSSANSTGITSEGYDGKGHIQSK